MAVIQRVLPTETFLSWLDKYNELADAANPIGSGTLEINNLTINGVVSFGSSSVPNVKSVQSYDFDPYYSPKMVMVNGKMTTEFADNRNCGIYFAFDMSEFRVLSSNRNVKFGYSTNSAGTGNTYWKYSYWVNQLGHDMNIADGTGFTVVDSTGTAGTYKTSTVAVLPISGLSDSSLSLLVKIERIGANVLDSCSSAIYLHDIRVE